MLGGSVGIRYACMMAHSVATLFDTSTLPSPAKPERSRQATLGQFFTPAPVAAFIAGLFSPPTRAVRLLDAGAGEGALTQAFVDRWREASVAVDAYEVDGAVLPALVTRLQSLEREGVTANAIDDDFLRAAAKMIRLERGQRYTHAILNPPYRKIATASVERQLARSVGLETVNLYSAFVGLALELMEPGGELAAIIPRSFCNGPYYRPFRDWLFERGALRRIHLFHSRRDAFLGDGVLQENVILTLERGGMQGDVTVSTSTGADFSDLQSQSHRFDEIVASGDVDRVISIPTSEVRIGDETGLTLAELELNVATGPVVDFRLRDHLRRDLDESDAPLVYPQHLKGGRLSWPIDGKKPNAIEINSTTKKWLIPTGWYVIVKRFSSKEERRRVVATLCDPTTLPGEILGIDNKLNIIRRGKLPLAEGIARGLTVYLNSSRVDEAFRLFSGHTQVNASDLRRMKFPTERQLELLGQAALADPPEDQQSIDAHVTAIVGDIIEPEPV